MKVEEYITVDGSNPYKDWFDALEPVAAAKVATAIIRLELGHTSSIKWLKGIGEYKVHWGPGYRVYLAQAGKDLIILFGGGTKKRQQADIKQAMILHREYKDRKRARQASKGRRTG